MRGNYTQLIRHRGTALCGWFVTAFLNSYYRSDDEADGSGPGISHSPPTETGVDKIALRCLSS